MSPINVARLTRKQVTFYRPDGTTVTRTVEVGFGLTSARKTCDRYMARHGYSSYSIALS